MESRRELIAKTLDILTDLAQRHETISYGDLLNRLGITGERRPIGQIAARYLDPVAVYCIAVGVPPLTVLVVNGPKSSKPGQPGSGFFVWFDDAKAARELVENHDWDSFPPPPFPI
ncbi:MAG: hypothetical protein OXE17_00780 [Chloroflexi bacterium]|nr:hypothetical protein [Chloroflexota bacterium]